MTLEEWEGLATGGPHPHMATTWLEGGHNPPSRLAPVSQLSYLPRIVYTEPDLSIHAFVTRSSFFGVGAVLSVEPRPHHLLHPRGDNQKCPQSSAYGLVQITAAPR